MVATATNVVRSLARQLSTTAIAAEDDVPAFVEDTIRSNGTVEPPVPMQQDVGHAWQAEEIARTMRANLRVELEEPGALEQTTLVRFDGNGLFRYRPAFSVRAETARQFVELHSRKRHAVAKTLHVSPGGERQKLADAFRVGK